MSSARLIRGGEIVLHASEVGEGSQYAKSPVVSEGSWPGVIPARLGSFVSPTAPKRQEITLSSAQLLVGAGSVLCSIFLFVWAVTRLWLSGR